MSGPKRERAKKDIIKAMKDLGLAITIQFGLKTVDFLDTTLDLTTSVYKPYRKPNDIPTYIHKNSNHPPNTIKQLPKMVNTRLSSISSNQVVFKEAVPMYQAALDKSGYSCTLKFEKPRQKNRLNTRTSEKTLTSYYAVEEAMSFYWSCS